MSANCVAVELRILNFLHTNFLKEEQINVHTSLFLSGLLDSLSMLTLLSFIEEFYHVSILDDDFTIHNFDTTRQIADHVKGCRKDA